MDADEIKSFLTKASTQELIDQLISLSAMTDEQSLETLKEFLRHRDDGLFEKHVTPRLVCLALVRRGSAGIAALFDVLPDAPGAIYPGAILEALWAVSKGTLPHSIFSQRRLNSDSPLLTPPSSEAQTAADQRIRDIVAESAVNEVYFSHLFNFIHSHNMVGNESESERRKLLSLLSEGNIKISRRLISKFSELVEAGENEESYQRFLRENPVFLDPLSSEVIPKQKLGLEFITDFVIRRHDDNFLLVEIEKPQDPIFTASNDFSSKFTHAVGQVLDFQSWIDAHGEYARSLMPRISSPRGLLVMGRKPAVAEQAQKLRRFNVNSTSIDILTYDDVLEQAERLYQNLFHKSDSST